MCVCVCVCVCVFIFEKGSCIIQQDVKLVKEHLSIQNKVWLKFSKMFVHPNIFNDTKISFLNNDI